MNKDKVIESRYAKKMVNPKFYGVVSVTGTAGTNSIPKIGDVDFSKEIPGIVYMPYKPLVTHVLISDADGTRRIRQVSRWFLFKLWLQKLTGKFKWNILEY